MNLYFGWDLESFVLGSFLECLHKVFFVKEISWKILVPLIVLSKVITTVLPPVNAKRWGNIFVWCSLFLGQPMIEILYIREFFEENADFFCVNSR